MPAEREHLLRLAEAVADETPIDWEGEANGSPATRRLRELAAMSEAYRTAWQNADGQTGLFRWGHLVVVDKLSAGSSGEVYRAWDPLLERDVALKLRRTAPTAGSSDAGHLVDEARRLARIRHPNVLAVYGADLHGGRVGVWTELVEGEDLKVSLARKGRLDVREAVRIGRDLCAALGAVHEAGLVHGDVKAANVLVGRDGRVVLSDFGSAVEASSGTISRASPATTAPEVLHGGRAGPASDIYSLGALLHQLVSGRLPVEAGSQGELMAAHAAGRRTSLVELRPDLPRDFVAAVERAVHPEPVLRFARVEEMAAALAAVPMEQPTAALAERASWGRRLALAATVAVAAVTLVFIGRTASLFRRPAEHSINETSAVPAVTATLYRTTGGVTSAVSSGDTVAPGDQLSLGVDTPEPVWVYVINGDDAGSSFVLFPLPHLDLVNPLPAGRHRLPGRLRGLPQDWRVTSAGGTEVFLVVAALRPLTDLEVDLDRVRAAAREPAEAQAGETLRGVGGLVDAPAALPQPGALDGIEAALRRDASRQGIWIQRFELRNPSAASH